MSFATAGFQEPLPGFKWVNFKEGKQELLGSLFYRSEAGDVFKVPKGFVTDYASVPSIFWNIPGFDPYGPAKFPAVLHDYLYSLRGNGPYGKTRPECDALFLEAMRLVGVGWLHRRIIWAAVRMCGGIWSMSEPWRKRGEAMKLESPGWGFTARVDGDDIVVDATTATWFGGPNDPLDNGQTASGVSTIANPQLLGCALPVCWWSKSTARSPLIFVHGGARVPSLPWRTPVVVTSGGKSLTVELIDNGPAKSAKDGIDLTIAAFEHFAPRRKGVIPVSYRIVGGYRLARKA